MDPYRQRQGSFLQKRNGAKGIPSPLRHSMTHFDWESEDEDDAMEIDSESCPGRYTSPSCSPATSSTPPSSPPRRIRLSSPRILGFDVDPIVADAISDFNRIVSDVLRARNVPSALKKLRRSVSTINYRIEFLASTMRDNDASPSMERERDVLLVEMEGMSNLFKQVKPLLLGRT